MVANDVIVVFQYSNEARNKKVAGCRRLDATEGSI